jgi:hypothetical protein
MYYLFCAGYSGRRKTFFILINRNYAEKRKQILKVVDRVQIKSFLTHIGTRHVLTIKNKIRYSINYNTQSTKNFLSKLFCSMRES